MTAADAGGRDITEQADLVVVGGGQAGLATARRALEYGRRPIVLESGAEPVGSWPRYYDSLRLFTPAGFCELPDLPFGGDPDRYPHRDEVVAYLRRYAGTLDAEIRTGTRVTALHVAAGGCPPGLVVETATARVAATSVVLATGGFSRPHRPELRGLRGYTGRVVHAADYRCPEPYAGSRVVVVGAGNTAVQVAVELAGHADGVVLASRRPVRIVAQHHLGRDVSWWLARTGLGAAPLGGLIPAAFSAPVLDDGRYRAALRAGRPRRRRMFTGAAGRELRWPDGHREHVDVVLLATGYRPALDFLHGLTGPGGPALDAVGRPRHRGGRSTAHPALGFVGLEWQRTLTSATLRGVGADADHVLRWWAPVRS